MSQVRKSTRERPQTLNSTIQNDSLITRKKSSLDSDSDADESQDDDEEEQGQKPKTSLPRRRAIKPKTKATVKSKIESRPRQSSTTRRKKPIMAKKRLVKDSDEETTESEDSDQEQVRTRLNPKIVQTVPRRPIAKPPLQKHDTAQLSVEHKSTARHAEHKSVARHDIEPRELELWQQYNLPPPQDTTTSTDEQGMQVYKRIQLNKQKKLEAKLAKDKNKRATSGKSDNAKRLALYLGAFLVVVFGTALFALDISKQMM